MSFGVICDIILQKYHLTDSNYQVVKYKMYSLKDYFMNHKIWITLGLAIIICGLGFYRVFANNTGKEINMSDKKVLIAYYSYSGNTKAVAEKIQNVTGGDLFEIQTVKEYPKNYNDVVSQAKTEKENDIRPALVDNGNTENYDIIFIGTPVWWYTMAPAVKTFIANNKFDGKTIVPFCTHGGGGASSTYTDMQKLAPQAKVTEGYTSYEDSATDNEIKQWISNLNL